VSNPLFAQVTIRYRQTQTSSGVRLKMHNTGLDRFGPTHFFILHHPCLGFDPYFENNWAGSTSQPLCSAVATSIS